MLIRDAFVASLLGIFGFASAASANSCANLTVIGTFDASGLRENDFGINAAGTFRIADETDEDKQPAFNLTLVNCEKQSYGGSLECKLTAAVVSAAAALPDANNPNCSLDMDFSTFSMKELSKGVLIGTEASASTGCVNTMALF